MEAREDQDPARLSGGRCVSCRLADLDRIRQVDQLGAKPVEVRRQVWRDVEHGLRSFEHRAGDSAIRAVLEVRVQV